MITYLKKTIQYVLHPSCVGYGSKQMLSKRLATLGLFFALLTMFVVPSPLAIAQHEQRSTVNADVNERHSAQEMAQPEGTDQDGEVEIEGWLLSRPDDGIGEWKIQKDEDKIIAVLADSDTRIDHGVPPVNVWVKVKGNRQSNGSILAYRIRVDDYKVDEVVIRLADNGVLSSTIASRYNLIAVDTLLSSGQIYLFRTTSTDSESDSVISDINKSHDSDVVWAEFNYVGSAPGGNPYKIWGWGGKDPNGYENQVAFEQVHLNPGQQYYKGQGLTVALLDTGVALDHVALKNHLVSGWDMVADDPDPQDEGPGFGWGHGTHVAGIVAHVAPDAKIMPIRVLNADGRGNTFTLAYAIEWAVQHNATVINLSLGTPNDSRVLRDAVADAIAKGVVIVAAAGNDDRGQPQYPAAYEGVISVSAVDGSNLKASFANYGSWVSLSAPGVGITSTITGSLGLGYASWSGTSMATGFVSGAVALLKQKLPSDNPAALAQRLESSGTDIQDSVNMGPLVNISAALGVDGGNPTVTPTPSITPQPTPTSTPVPTSPVEETQNTYLPFVVR